MSVHCHFTCKYNSDLHHFRMGEYKKTDNDKQACITNTLTLTLILNKIYFDFNEKDEQQEIDYMLSRYQLIYIVLSHGDHTKASDHFDII